MIRWLLASAHLLAFGIGLGAVWIRRQALLRAPEPGAVKQALRADLWWGVAALLWLATGLPRLFMAFEKPTGYYLANHVFWTKMAVFTLVVLLELGPAVGLTRWRAALRRGAAPDTTRAPRWAAISGAEAFLVVVLLLLATAVARGFGGR